MITVYSAMLIALGFLLGALLLLFVLPAYRRRIERFAMERLKRELPLTEAEIKADKDRLRAEFAIDVHKLEMKLEEESLAAARQTVEINRREAKIHDLQKALDAQRSNVEEHQNARNVLEQAITVRLPKVEARLAEARKSLLQRDREIAALTETSSKQTEALEQATQINLQLTEEIHRLKAALETRAARNREALSDPGFDGEVALRTELESLRAQTREQSQHIERLQTSIASGETGLAADSALRADIERLRADLAAAEGQLHAFRSHGDAERVQRDAQAEQIRKLEQLERDRSAEIASLKAALKSYETAAAAASASTNSDAAADAEISGLQAELDEQRRTIQALRAEVASGAERLSRQAQHFRDEMRRVSMADRSEPQDAARPTLSERIAQPRVPKQNEVSQDDAQTPRSPAYLRPVNGGADEPAADNDRHAEQPEAPKRGRLLERISNIDKKG